MHNSGIGLNQSVSELHEVVSKVRVVANLAWLDQTLLRGAL